jgi:membrane fusion protein, copper/silver efflux system
MKRLALGILMAELAAFGFALGRITALPASDVETPKLVPAVMEGAHHDGRKPSDVLIPSSGSQRIPAVRVERVNHHAGSSSLRTTGRVASNEARTYRVFAGSDGRLSTLGNNAPGTMVRKGQMLATFFSNDLVKAEQAYFFSLQTLERVKASNRSADVRQAQESIRANEEILLSSGMGEPQIRELAKTRQATRDISIVSPADGIVVARNLFQQQSLQREEEIFRIIDLNRVWIFANVLPGEIPVLGPSTRAKVIVRQTGKSFEAVVSSAMPLVDSDRRMLQLKLEAQNPGLALRPDMYVDVEFQIPSPAGVSVPHTAVIDDGIAKIVYVETGPHTFEPRAVELAGRLGDRVFVRQGLSNADRVVVSGHFLRDSESRLRPESLRAAVTESD